MLEIIRTDKNLASSDASEPRVILRRNNFESSTKLDALIQNLRMLLHFLTSTEQLELIY